VDADPDPGRRSLHWLIRTYVRGGFLLSDLPAARLMLERFSTCKRWMGDDDRDLNRYSTLGELASALSAIAPVDEASTTPAGREKRRLDRDTARAESELLVELDDGFTVAVPLTERAARWWGRGTRWCTSADNENSFRVYAEEAAILVIVLPNGEKLQFFSGAIPQFKDAGDQVVRPELATWWHLLSPIVTWATRRYPAALRFVPEEFQTRESCLAAVTKDGVALPSVASRYLDDSLWLAAVRSCGTALHAIPLERRSRDICLAAMRHDRRALSYVPPGLVDGEILELASQDDQPRATIARSRESDITMERFDGSHYDLDDLRSAFREAGLACVGDNTNLMSP
jgi:hypothetical protein